MLTAFYQSLIHSTMFRLENGLNQLLQDYQGGHKEASSVISLATPKGAGDDAAWPQVIRDLEDLGISEDIINQYRSFIVGWFVKAINDGMLREPIFQKGGDGSSITECSTVVII